MSQEGDGSIAQGRKRCVAGASKDPSGVSNTNTFEQIGNADSFQALVNPVLQVSGGLFT